MRDEGTAWAKLLRFQDLVSTGAFSFFLSLSLSAAHASCVCLCFSHFAHEKPFPPLGEILFYTVQLILYSGGS